MESLIDEFFFPPTKLGCGVGEKSTGCTALPSIRFCSKPRPQQQVLYADDWPKSVDHEFVKQLAKFAEGREQPIKNADNNIIGASIEVVNRKLRTNYTIQVAQYWFTRLEKRHRAFSFATTVAGVEYDPANNTIKADGWLWDYIYVKHNIAEAYMIHGEPEWEKLQVILGPAVPASLESLPDVIQISDDSVEIVSRPLRRFGGNTSSCRRTESHQSSNQTLGSSFWNCLDPIVQLSDGASQGSPTDSARRRRENMINGRMSAIAEGHGMEGGLFQIHLMVWTIKKIRLVRKPRPQLCPGESILEINS